MHAVELGILVREVDAEVAATALRARERAAGDEAGDGMARVDEPFQPARLMEAMLAQRTEEAAKLKEALDRPVEEGVDRGRVRRQFEERFTVGRMARDYLSVYKRLIGEPWTRIAEPAAPPATAKANGRKASN